MTDQQTCNHNWQSRKETSYIEIGFGLTIGKTITTWEECTKCGEKRNVKEVREMDP